MAARGARTQVGVGMKSRRRTETKTKRASAPKVSRRRKPSSTNANTKFALLTRERNEAIEQQRATSEILQAISNSPTDAASTLGAIAESVARLLDVTDADIIERRGQRAQVRSNAGSIASMAIGNHAALEPGLGNGASGH